MAVSNEAFYTAYLARIGYTGDTAPTPDNLRAIRRCHLSAVPFENLDILAGLPPTLDREYLFDKIVLRRRGGVCYELNRSFHNLLEAMGFDVTYITGQVKLWGTFLDHAISMVRFGQECYLVDVGFGDDPTAVVPLRHGASFHEYGADYSIAVQGDIFHLRKQLPGRLPLRMYSFLTVPRTADEALVRYRYSATPGNSAFANFHICALQIPDGRLSLVKDTFRIIKNGHTQVIPADTQKAREQILREYFDLP